MSDAVENGVYLAKVLSELLFNDTYCIPVEVMTDSKTLYDALHSKKNVLEKFLRIDIVLLKNLLIAGQLPKFIMLQFKAN